MAAEVASPNGVFKRLDLDEKEDMASPTEVDIVTTTPIPAPVPAGATFCYWSYYCVEVLMRTDAPLCCRAC